MSARTLASAGLALALGAGALPGQARVQPALGAAAQYVRLGAELPGVTDFSSGEAAGVEGGLTIGSLVRLNGTYLQGTLHSSGAGAASRDVIEGRLGLGLAPLPWLALSVGPHVRSYVDAGGTERWVRWETRARAQVPIGLTGVTGYVAGWRVLSATVDLPGSFDRGQGGEAGLAAVLPRAPGLWARLAYGVDRVAMTGRVETLEALTFTVGIGRP